MNLYGFWPDGQTSLSLSGSTRSLGGGCLSTLRSSLGCRLLGHCLRCRLRRCLRSHGLRRLGMSCLGIRRLGVGGLGIGSLDLSIFHGSIGDLGRVLADSLMRILCGSRRLGCRLLVILLGSLGGSLLGLGLGGSLGGLLRILRADVCTLGGSLLGLMDIGLGCGLLALLAGLEVGSVLQGILGRLGLGGMRLGSGLLQVLGLHGGMGGCLGGMVGLGCHGGRTGKGK